MNMIGEKVTLKAIEESDLVFLADLFNDPESGETVGGWSPPVSLYQQRQWFETIGKNANVLRYAIWENSSGELIGMCSIADIDPRNRTGELHTRTKIAKAGKGFGTEILYLLLKVAFEYLDLALVNAVHLAINERSERLVTHVGFVKEATLRARIFKHGERQDLVVYSMMMEEYLVLKNKYESSGVA